MNLVDVVIVTGAGRGIGRSIALDFGKQGIPVLCISKSSNAGNVAKEITNDGGIAESLSLDLSNYETVENEISKWILKTSYKKIGIVLAAAILGPKGPLTNCSLKEWDDCHRVNILGNLAVLKSLFPRMLENKFGRIVMFSGGGAAYANPAFPGYSSTKTATVRIAENIYEDLKDKGDFLITCFGPGAVETDMLKEFRTGGGEVKATTKIEEPVLFVREFINARTCGLSGRFVHVRNSWKEYINSSKTFDDDSMWKLRRVE